MDARHGWGVVLLVAGLATLAAHLGSQRARGDDPQAVATEPGRGELEAEFARTMSHAVLRGSFTLTGASEQGRGLTEERYTLGEVKKLEGDHWLFNTRIQYGDHDVTLPLTLVVEWAGDTPVITLTDLPIPGLGTFTARVLVYRDHYAGFWSGGGDHGGHLFGRIERAPSP